MNHSSTAVDSINDLLGTIQIRREGTGFVPCSDDGEFTANGNYSAGPVRTGMKGLPTRAS